MKLHKTYLTLIFIILCSLSVHSMNKDAIYSTISREDSFTVIDTTIDIKIPAEFPGGFKEWQNYLAKNVDYNLPLRNGAPVGKYQVIVNFKIDTAGSIIDVRAENDFGYGMTEEAIRALKNAPKWIPASINGVKVIYRHRQAVVFSIYEN